MSNLLKWRVMCFDKQGDKLVKIINLGELDFTEVKNNINPSDKQEMCGSYKLNLKKLKWLQGKVNNPDLQEIGFDMFLERET